MMEKLTIDRTELAFSHSELTLLRTDIPPGNQSRLIP